MAKRNIPECRFIFVYITRPWLLQLCRSSSVTIFFATEFLTLLSHRVDIRLHDSDCCGQKVKNRNYLAFAFSILRFLILHYIIISTFWFLYLVILLRRLVDSSVEWLCWAKSCLIVDLLSTFLWCSLYVTWLLTLLFAGCGWWGWTEARLGR